jgi:branched-chain amino acid transport system ATP-binding protein
MSETALAQTRPLLELDAVSAGYGETMVLEEITLAIAAGESVSLIGRNGVGKTTLLATIMGHTRLHGGRLRLAGEELSAIAIHRRARAGLGYVPQEREIFPSLSVRENLEVAARPGRWTLPALFELFPRLKERERNRGNQLSGGEQQMLAIARALVGNPRLVLMDEPSEGLAPVIVEELARALHRLRESEGLTLLLVEQNLRLALALSPRTIVMDRGRITYDGESARLARDRAQLDALIGVGRG